MLNRAVRSEIPRMLGQRVETLYFDLLQFLYHLALAVLVGGMLVLGTAVAPALFGPRDSSHREPPAVTRTQAGALFGAVLARFDGYAILALVVLVVTSALKSSFEVTGTPEPAPELTQEPLVADLRERGVALVLSRPRILFFGVRHDLVVGAAVVREGRILTALAHQVRALEDVCRDVHLVIRRAEDPVRDDRRIGRPALRPETR